MIGFAKEEKGLYHLIDPPLKKTFLDDENYGFQCNVVSIHT